jgi:hypothetical protein
MGVERLNPLRLEHASSKQVLPMAEERVNDRT